MEIFRNPVYETKIVKAVFINQDIVVFPSDLRVPNNLSEVVKFLFGEGATVVHDCVNNRGCIKITGASYVLDNVKTLNAEWTYREVTKDA